MRHLIIGKLSYSYFGGVHFLPNIIKDVNNCAYD